MGDWCQRKVETHRLRYISQGLAAADRVQRRAEHDAQAALYLLRSDITRMRTNTIEMQSALARLYAVSNAVDKEDWVAAREVILSLKTSYGRSGSP